MSYGYPPPQGDGRRPDQGFPGWSPPPVPFAPQGVPGYRPTPPPGFGVPPPVARPPDNYLVWAVVATVLCCFVAGIPALLAATQVNERWYAGDAAGAHTASLRARNWTIGTVILGVIFWTTWMVGVFVLGWKNALGHL